MNYSDYIPTKLELWINDLYQSCNIQTPRDLDIYRVAEAFQATVRLSERETKVYHDEYGNHLIFLNSQKSEMQQRAEFFHELCHLVQHKGIQQILPQSYVELQEIQANQFRLYAAMPYHMIINEYRDYLQNTNIIPLIVHDFKLPYLLVKARMDQIIRRITRYEEDKTILNSVPRHTPTVVSHSKETLQLIAKLSWLSAQKGRKINWGR